MEPSERQRAEDLDRYWDAVQRGESPERGDIDELAAAVVAHLGERRATADQEAAQRRVRIEVVNQAKAVQPVDRAVMRTVPSSTKPRPESRERGPLPLLRDGARRSLPYLATIALLLITVGLAAEVGLVGIRGRWSDALPVAAPDTSIAGVTVERTLFHTTLPAEALPQGDQVSGGLSHFTVKPGATSRWEPPQIECCPGVRVDHVLEGELVVRPEGPARILRPGVELSPALAAPGSQIVLRPGETLVTRYGDPFTSENSGDIPVRLLDWILVDRFVTPNRDNPTGWDFHFDADFRHNLVLPEGPEVLRLERVVLPPGTRLAPDPGVVAMFGVTLADDEPLDPRDPSALANATDQPIIVHVLTLAPAFEAETAMGP